MFKSVKFSNFKGMREYSVTLREMNVLVGPNNAGKSTILDAFRVLSVALKHARRRNPTAISVNGRTQAGWEIPSTQLPISLANIHSDYQDEIETSVTFTLTNGNKIHLTFEDNSRCVLTVDETGSHTRNTTQFRRNFPVEIASFPTLGPLEEHEDLLSDPYVERWQGSRLTHRMFRNVWYRNRDRFPEFQRLVEQTWPGMSVRPPELHGYAPARLSMFCEENRALRELSWAGFGFQVWLQILTHFMNAASATTLVVDEPEIYLHPDLQHRLFQLLRTSRQQVILATHSVEIVNEADHDEVVLINRTRRSAKRVGDIEGLQEALFSIGSGQNIHLAKLSRGKKILFLEGQDYKLLKRFAARAGFSAISDDINITVVPIGGFTQRQRIEDAAWTFERVLRAEIAIAALLDRDYRCNDEIEELVTSARAAIPHFHVLGSKEIENYLLVPPAITRATQERLRERQAASTISQEQIEATLLRCTEEIKSDVIAQLIANRVRFSTGRDSRDPATVMSDALRQLDSDWRNLSRRLSIIPGKQILTALNRELQREFQVSITAAQIIRHLAVEEIDPSLQAILSDLNNFAAA